MAIISRPDIVLQYFTIWWQVMQMEVGVTPTWSRTFVRQQLYVTLVVDAFSVNYTAIVHTVP